MAAPLAHQRAHYLAKGVEFELDGIQERLLTDYFLHERLLRFYELKIVVTAIQSLAATEKAQQVADLIHKYYTMLFPETAAKGQRFVQRAKEVIKKYEDQLFLFGGDRTGLKGKVTAFDTLREKLEAIKEKDADV